MSTMQIVDIPAGMSRGWGQFSAVIDSLRLLEEGKCLRIDPLTSVQNTTLRSAARVRGLLIHVRNTPEAAYVWVKGRTESVNEARARRAQAQ